jgi:nucleoside-diphosphate-sugar epimerase
MNSILIVGCGDIGQRVATLELADGSRVKGLSRSEQTTEHLQSLGIQPIRGDLDQPASLQHLPAEGTLLYYFAPPSSMGVSDPHMEALVSVLTSPNLPRRVILISTTGVYGNCRGEWITEERLPHPETDRARRRLDSENRLRSWSDAENVPIVILRVPGIYGPGRLPEQRLREGHPVLREEESPFTNRIHADDLARVCVAASRHGRAGTHYNISDGNPTTMTDYFYRVADMLGLPRPPSITFEQARQQLSAGMLSYLSESKRIVNRRMCEDLCDPLYPDLERGLPSCLDP